MKITKFVHSCVLVEVDGKEKVLIDPGEYTWAANQLTDKHLSNIDYLVITHEHADHYLPEAIKAVLAKSPNTKIKAGPAVVKLLQGEGIPADSDNDNTIKLAIGEHSRVWEFPIFENTKVMVADKLLHVGDSMDTTETPAVLCLPMFGPWLNGTLSDAGLLIEKLKPKYVVPIHDWHYKEEVRASFVKRLQDYFEPKGTHVVGGELAKTYDLDV
jgi:L-ascorbate metabolism protein UlaG (beta-lactamase superfamily)